jgi:hypothetical protein
MRVTLNDVLSFFHVDNFANASEDEATFFFSLHFCLHANAKVLARDAQGKCDRACKAVLTAMAQTCERVP